ncbi:MAG TPA: Eco57I restriction-modification methylase domain-containing protein [Thermoguttaceae bacterium]|nr:Eco57I restriction-modification methylase domain-containing protein [Thermoguttaceae bacterium]
MVDLLSYTTELQKRHENSTSALYRRQAGQVFTPVEIARFMAGLLSHFPAEYRLLDAGAGLGVLTAAVCERFFALRSPRHIEVHVFENEPKAIPLLEQNLEHCRKALEDAGHALNYVIHDKDFIIATASSLDAQRTLDGNDLRSTFDAAIMNPPYFKVRKTSAHAKLMSKVVHGQPNVYAFFLALGAQLLKEGAELVAITPRSYCNGLYFRGFRKWFLQRMALDHLHLFESRTAPFKSADVLQESVITKGHRLGNRSATVRISTSHGPNLDEDPEGFDVASDRVIDDSCGESVLRIPTSNEDGRIMELVESFPCRFSELGLCISTGPIVMFRATEFLLDDNHSQSSVPLLLPHNIEPFGTKWPVRKNGKPIAFSLRQESMRLLLPSKNYVLLKRFSAKEERRRLTAGCFFPSVSKSQYVGIENHLNYIYHSERDLTDEDVYGLAAVFNSVLLDRYFRTISGNTQVNATEIRSMNFPDMNVVAKIGRQVRSLPVMTADRIERIVLTEFRVRGSLREYLLEHAG